VITKPCMACGVVQPITDFPRDAKRPDGRFPYCLSCHRTRSRERRRQKKLAHDAQHTGKSVIAPDEVWDLMYKDREPGCLADRVRREARRQARGDRDLVDDLHSEAWMYIGLAISDLTDDAYFDIAVRVMRAYRRKEAEKRDYSLDELESMSKSAVDQFWPR